MITFSLKNYSLIVILLLISPLAGTTRGPAKTAAKKSLKPMEQKLFNDRLLNSLAKRNTTKQDIIDLLEQGAQSTATDAQGRSALIIAQENNRPDLVEILTSAQSQQQVVYHAPQPAIKKAHGHAQIPMVASSKIEQPKNFPTVMSSTELAKKKKLDLKLIEAARDGRKADVIALLKEGAHVNGRDADDETPLIAAAANHLQPDPSVIDVLIAAGADVNANDNNWPAFFAATFINLEAVPDMNIQHKLLMADKLVKAGANVNAKNYDGDTALHILARFPTDFNSVMPMLELILQNNPNLNIRNERGTTPLSTAILSRNREFTKRLLQEPYVQINIPDAAVPPLDMAIWVEDVELAKMLLDAGAEITEYTRAFVQTKNNPAITKLINAKQKEVPPLKTLATRKISKKL
jgi:ankyrin repeat protein